jgi:uncharacterized membrane protein HdeD (DUF308 family)
MQSAHSAHSARGLLLASPEPYGDHVTGPRFGLAGNTLTRHWPRLVIIGVLDVVIGILAVAWPGVTVLALALILGVLLIVSGVMSISFGLTMRRTGRAWIWPVLLGVFSVIAAIIIIIHPGAGIAAIAFGAALWFLLTGITDLVRATTLPGDRLWWGFLGAISLIAGIILLFDLGAAILTVALIAGIFFIVRGVGEIAAGWHLRRLNRAT